MKALEAINVPFRVVVEHQERDKYASVLGAGRVLVLDPRYQDDYDTFDTLGDEKSKGPGPARNFAWDHAISEGHPWHWVMDDNIRYFYRFKDNQKIRVGDGTMFRVMEDFCLRFENIAMAGPNYLAFVVRHFRHPDVMLNTRIYSCNLIRNDAPFRWRGRYNEDTDLSLRMLKGHWCTAQFNGFLQDKHATQTVKGGNTAEFYAREGTGPKSEMLVRMHPDVASLAWRRRRVHHVVNYSIFKQRLVPRADVEIAPEPNEYGMRVVNIHEQQARAV